MSATASACFLFYLSILTSHLPTITLPINIHGTFNGINAGISDVSCDIYFGSTTLNYTLSGLYVTALENTVISCNSILNKDTKLESGLSFDVGFQKGDTILVETTPTSEVQCTAANVNAKSLSLSPKIFRMEMKKGNHAPFKLLTTLTPLISTLLSSQVESIYKSKVDELGNFTPVERSILPPFSDGMIRVRDSKIAKTFFNVINNFPSVFQTKMFANYEEATGIQIGTTLNNNVSVIPYFARLETTQQFGISLTFGFPALTCDQTGFKCNAEKGIGTFNFLTNSDTTVPLLDVIVFPTLTGLLNHVLNYTSGQAVAIEIDSIPPRIIPPVWCLATFTPIFLVVIIASIAYSVWRHKKDPAICYTTCKPISMYRIILEDFILLITVFSCIFMFICSNLTHMSSFVIGDYLIYRVVTLSQTIQDLWDGDFKFLAILICFFSGAYPYIKLLCIYIYCIFLRHPRSRILRLIDNIGKFSLLDIFIIGFLKSSMDMPGLVIIDFQISYSLFISATLFSIAIGNYANHCWRYQTSLRPKDVFDNLYVIDHKSETTKRKEWYRIWEWKMTIPGLLFVILGSVVICRCDIFHYTMVSFVSQFFDKDHDYSFITILNSERYLTFVSIVTVVIIPCIYVVTFPYTHFLSAWCASDVFLVAALCAQAERILLHLDLLGRKLYFYGMDCFLHWPIVFLGFSILVQWFFILKHNMSIAGFPTIAKIRESIKAKT